MKTSMIIRVVVVVLLSGLCTKSFAQAQGSDSSRDQLDFLIPPVEVFIDSALVQNGMLNYRKLDLDVREADVRTKSRIWTQNLGLRGDLRYGTFNNFVSTDTGAANTNIATLSQQLNYGIGLYIQLPVFDAWNRKNEVKRAKMQVAQAQSLVEEQEEVIRERVIRQYEDLQLKYELLKIQSSNYGNASVNMEMVEKEFRNGQVPVYEYVRLSDITSRIHTEYEKAKSDFLLAKQLLENTSGISIR